VEEQWGEKQGEEVKAGLSDSRTPGPEGDVPQ